MKPLASQLNEIRQMRIEDTEDFETFVRVYFKHHLTSEDCSFHHDLYEDLGADTPNKRIVRIAPRGHGKTTVVCLFYPIWCLATGRKQTILIMGSSQDLANQKLIELTGEVEHNTLLMNDYPDLKPQKDFKGQYKKYTDSHVIFEGGRSIMAKGMNARVRGINPRPDLIIIDDPERDADVDNPNLRAKIKRTFDSVIRYLGKPGSVLDIIVIDTLKHFDSLIQYIYNKSGWDSKKYSAIVDDTTKRVLWDTVYCYDILCLTPAEVADYTKRGAIGYERIRIPFYGRMDDFGIIGLAEENAESFGQEFLGLPIQTDLMPLRRELWQYCDHSPDQVSMQSVRVGALDLSMGKRGGDWQAIAVVGCIGQDYYLNDASLTKFPLVSGTGSGENDLARLCMLYITTYSLQAFIIEDNGAQGLFINALNRALREEEKKTGEMIRCRIIAKPSKGDKQERINGNLGLVMQRGSFHIRRDWERCYGDFMRQFEYYPKGGHDDAPDVANMAVMAIMRAKARII